MRILNSDELHIAERILQSHLPKVSKVYGFLLSINRNKLSTLEVVVDTWPDFKVIIFRPDARNKLALEYRKKVTFYCTDEQILKRMLIKENAIDWSTRFLIGGFDFGHVSLLKDISSSRGVNMRCFTIVHLMSLADCSVLPQLTPNSEIESRISSLNESHIDLVNKTWKFGGDEKGYMIIQDLIRHYPTCCITDSQGQPLAWILQYDYCALGLLFTQPEHRGKGYAKVLVSTMAKKLHARGYPVYCFIEEENTRSYRLFKDLGFTEDPSYRAAWFEFNY